MSEPEDIEDIREQKRRELMERAGASAEADPDAEAQRDATADSPAEPIHVEGAAHLDELTSDHDVVLVDYYADWCGPCQMLEPIVESIAEDTAATVAKVDIDRHQDLASQAGVRGVPTMVLHAGGEAVEQLVGVQDEAKLRQLIERHS